MTAHHFVLTSLETGAMLGQALICPEARYASVRWKGADRLDRRFVPALSWKAIERELQDGWPKGLVAVGSTVFLTIVPKGHRGSLQVQFRAGPPIDAVPAAAAQALDGYLNAQRFI